MLWRFDKDVKPLVIRRHPLRHNEGEIRFENGPRIGWTLSSPSSVHCVKPSVQGGRDWGRTRDALLSARMDAALLRKEVLQLPDGDRALLADSLLASLSPTPVALQEAWIREADERLEVFRKGRITAVDGPSALADLKARF